MCTDAHRHPCFNMVVSDASGRCRVAIDNGKKLFADKMWINYSTLQQFVTFFEVPTC